MKLKLYSYYRSSAAYRVRIALNLKGLAYQLAAVNLLGAEHRGDAYLALNPQGLVPALDLGDGRVITQRVKLPCLICADADINTPRLPSYKRKRSLKNENIGLVSLKDFMDADETHYGLTGSPTQVERIFPPENNAVRQILEGGSTTLADALHDLLKMKKFI